MSRTAGVFISLHFALFMEINSAKCNEMNRLLQSCSWTALHRTLRLAVHSIPIGFRSLILKFPRLEEEERRKKNDDGGGGGRD